MGAPPSEEQIADMLSNPAIAQTMNEALNNPSFVDHMIQSNPMLQNMPNAREMLQSPYFRSMMTNPDALRMAARMRRVMGGNGGPDSFPAPGATDTTPQDAPSSGGTAGANNAQGQNPFPFPFPPGMPGAAPGAEADGNLFASLMNPFGIQPPRPDQGANSTSPPAADGSTGRDANGGASAQPPTTQAQNAQANPFAALFGGMPGAQGGAGGGASAQNPLGLTPEMMQQAMQMWGPGGLGGLGGFGSPSPAQPSDNRPPEERYAEQLRQLNDMGFYDFDRNVSALRRSGGSVQGAVEHLLSSL